MAPKRNVLDQYRCADIYNALDTGNSALALTQADAVLRKGPFALARALRAIALVRLHRDDEAAAEVERVLQGNIDAGVLTPLSYIMPRLGMAQRLAELYVLASQTQPNDTALASEALTALLKAGLFQRALQLLLKEFRAKNEPKVFWQYLQVAILHVRVSTYQSHQLKPPGSTLALQLALRLLKEHPVDVAKLTEETMVLYVRFHLLLGNAHLAAALTTLDAPRPKQLAEKSLGVQFLLREAWDVHGDDERILDDCRTRIVQGDRNWAVISLYVSTLVSRAVSKSGALSDADVRVLLDAAERDRYKDRGSFLGVLELMRRTRAAEMPVPAMQATYVDEVVRYFTTFATRASCFEDLYPYLTSLTDEEQAAFVSATASTPPLTSEDAVVRYGNQEKTLHLLQPVDPAEAVGRILTSYSASLEHTRLPATEMQLGDDLALLAVYDAIQLHTDALALAAAIAARAVTESARAYRVRIALIRLLLQLGAPKLALAEYRSLGLKAVQLDTASHLGLDRNAAFGGSMSAEMQREWDDHLHPFYQQSDAELPDAVGLAFGNSKFSQIAGICAFQHSLQTSCARAVMELDLVRGKLIDQELVDAEATFASKTVQRLVAMVQTSELSDQRDTSLLPSYQELQGERVQQTLSCGPRRGTGWVRCMLEVATLALGLPAPDHAASDNELTEAESALVAFARTLRTTGPGTGPEPVTAFFDRTCRSLIQKSTRWSRMHPRAFPYCTPHGSVSRYVARTNHRDFASLKRCFLKTHGQPWRTPCRSSKRSRTCLLMAQRSLPIWATHSPTPASRRPGRNPSLFTQPRSRPTTPMQGRSCNANTRVRIGSTRSST